MIVPYPKSLQVSLKNQYNPMSFVLIAWFARVKFRRVLNARDWFVDWKSAERLGSALPLPSPQERPCPRVNTNLTRSTSSPTKPTQRVLCLSICTIAHSISTFHTNRSLFVHSIARNSPLLLLIAFPQNELRYGGYAELSSWKPPSCSSSKTCS